MLGCDAVACGTPGTDAPGTRGNENTSLRPAKWGSSVQGSVLPSADDVGTVARSDPLGGAVCGDDGIEGTPGKEYISAAGGICAAVAQGPPFSALKDDDAAGTAAGGVAAVTCGASGSAPASEAAMARKSASFRTAVGDIEGGWGTPALVIAGKENVSRG
jgi:hypothetical protein